MWSRVEQSIRDLLGELNGEIQPIESVSRTFLLGAAMAAFIIGGLFAISLLILILETFRGTASAGDYASFASAVTTFLLVLLTAWYAYQTRNLVQESRKTRRRPTERDFIAHSIDPILQQIDQHHMKMVDQVYPGISVLPELEPIEIPNQEFLDLKRKYPELAEDILEYSNLSEEYSKRWEKAREGLEEKLKREGHVGGRASKFAKYILEVRTHFNDVSISDSLESDWRKGSDDLIELRRHEEIQELTTNCKAIYHRLFRRYEPLLEEIHEVRTEHRTRYDILETEISLQRENGDS